MNLDLQKRLLCVEAETFDVNPPGRGFNLEAGEGGFSRFCLKVLDVYQKLFTGITAGSVSVSGLEPGFLKPIASWPGELRKRVPKLESAAASELAKNKWEVVRPSEHVYLRNTIPSAKQALVVRLIGYGEYYGVLVLYSNSESYFTGETLSDILESRPLLNRLMAEANFSNRLITLAAPFSLPPGPVSKELMYQQIVRQACLGLAADGAVLRIRKSNDIDPSDDALEVKGWYGSVSDAQLVRGSVGERICRRFFRSPDLVTAQTLRPNDDRISRGVELSDEDIAELRELGVQAYAIMKLQSDLSTDEPPVAIGTLSVFHRLPQEFSSRDITLFFSFCERVADDLALLDQRDANEAISKLLEAQNSLGTRAELTALLGHDFGHRVYHVQAGLKDFIEACTRYWSDRTLPKKVKAEAKALQKSCDELAEIVYQLRLLGQGTEEPATTFNVGEVFDEIHQTLRTVLERNNMALETKVEGNCCVEGKRGILRQSIFNLVINAVDAHKASGKKKLNTVHLTCREVGSGVNRKLDFKIWDEGPGISRNSFPNAQHIFDVGRSSKPAGQGTGTGLPVARSLLGRYFHADLGLTDRSKALFHFTIPLQRGQS